MNDTGGGGGGRGGRVLPPSLPPSLLPLQIDVTVSVPEDRALPVDPVPAAAPWGSPRPVCWMRPNPTTSKVTNIGTLAFWSDAAGAQPRAPVSTEETRRWSLLWVLFHGKLPVFSRRVVVELNC